MATHAHQSGGPVCIHATKKACDDAYADWQAMQQVLLAWKIAVARGPEGFKRGKDVFSQLVRVVCELQPDIMNDDGNPSQAAWVKRLRSAMQRAIAGDLPVYNSYALIAQSEKES